MRGENGLADGDRDLAAVPHCLVCDGRRAAGTDLLREKAGRLRRACNLEPAVGKLDAE